jgi:hypothetical protein
MFFNSKQVGGGSWTPIQQALFAYWGASTANGSLNDLQSSTQQLPNGTGGWNTVGVTFYRYWKAGSATGFAHGQKMRFGPEAYRLLFNAGIDPATAADATLHELRRHPSPRPSTLIKQHSLLNSVFSELPLLSPALGAPEPQPAATSASARWKTTTPQWVAGADLRRPSH